MTELERLVSQETLEQILAQDDSCLVSIASVKRALKQKPTTQERQAESDRFDAAFQDGYNNGYAQARFDYEQEPTNTIDYCRAFKIACDLLNGDILYGVDTDKIYELMMQKDGVVSNSSYEEYILNHLQELDQGQYASRSEIPTGSIHCQHTDEEITKSFIEDVETVKDQLSCGEQMDFPSTFDEFAKDYGFKDEDEVYTNGSELIPVFRVKQWLEHISTTKNDLALIHTEGLDEEIRCTMCTNNMKSDRGCDGSCVVNKDMYKAVMDAIEKRIQPTTKNDLGVDCVSRRAVNSLIWKYLRKETDDNIAFYEHFLELPSITPIRPKGHWIYKEFDERTGMTNVHICSKCGCPLASPYKSFCSACGSDNREVKV